MEVCQMIEIAGTAIDDVVELRPIVHADQRGSFVKTVQASTYSVAGLATEFVETYFSSSHRGVLRGMHFQLPPHEHAKVVYCVDGKVLDAIIDLRVGSPTFQRHVVMELDGSSVRGVYVPPGCAHGFCVVSPRATVLYQVTTEFAPEHDYGVRWDTAGIPWPNMPFTVSERDAALPAMGEFRSPFRWTR